MPKIQNFDSKKQGFISKLDKLKRQFALKDNDTLGRYHQAFWEEFIFNAGKQYNYNIPNKILLVAEGIRKKISLDRIFKLSKIDPWFLGQIKEIVDCEINLKKIGLPKNFTEFNRIKSIGFSDKKLSELTNLSEDVVRKKRIALKILPVYKKVDTCAAEFKSFTPYMYSTYQRNFSIVSECEAEPTSKKKIIIL